MPRHFSRTVWLPFLLTSLGLALSFPRHARAEYLAFKTGGSIHIPARIHDGVVAITLDGRTYRFPESDFRKIVPGGSPEAEWPTRRDQALAGGAAPRFVAACWALENGLTPEAVSMLRAAHASDPGHQPTARVCAVLDRLEPPFPDADPTSLLCAFRLPLQSTPGPHVILLHQGQSPTINRRLDLLERVTTTFYIVFAIKGIDLEIPDRKMVSVYLDRKSDYLAFLGSQRASAFRSAQGFYHPDLHAVIAYDARPDETNPIRDEPLFASATDREHLKRALLRRSEATSRDLGIAAHEMVHQLIEASGLSPRPGAFPTWLHEGLASQFEVVRAGRWAGVGQANDLRLDDWRRQSSPGFLSATTRDAHFARGYSPALYARSWSLVYFLNHDHPEQFHAYLDRLRQPSPPADPFTEAFPEKPTALEAEWKAFMSRVATPLESHLKD